MKNVVLIPVKLGSKRVPSKNTKPFFDGTPLMYFIQRTCLKAKLVDEVYIYCSDESVKDYVLPGVRFLKRPDFLDSDFANANDIIREFMKTVDLIGKVACGEYDSAFCAENIKTFLWSEGRPLNFDPDHFPRTQDLPDIYGETSIAYVFTKESFLKHNRRLGERPYIREVGKIEAMDIDYPEDFEIANAVYKEVVCR